MSWGAGSTHKASAGCAGGDAMAEVEAEGMGMGCGGDMDSVVLPTSAEWQRVVSVFLNFRCVIGASILGRPIKSPVDQLPKI